MSETLQYFLGLGITGVLATQIATTVRAWRKRVRERNGMLRILFAELHWNQVPLEAVARAGAGQMKETDKRAASDRILTEEVFLMETWKETRVKLAQQLPSKKFAILAGYYSELLALQEEPLKRKVQGATKEFNFRLEAASQLYQKGQKVEQVIRCYVPDVVTDEITMGDLLASEQRLNNAGEDKPRT